LHGRSQYYEAREELDFAEEEFFSADLQLTKKLPRKIQTHNRRVLTAETDPSGTAAARRFAAQVSPSGNVQIFRLRRIPK